MKGAVLTVPSERRAITLQRPLQLLYPLEVSMAGTVSADKTTDKRAEAQHSASDSTEGHESEPQEPETAHQT